MDSVEKVVYQYIKKSEQTSRKAVNEFLEKHNFLPWGYIVAAICGKLLAVGATFVPLIRQLLSNDLDRGVQAKIVVTVL